MEIIIIVNKIQNRNQVWNKQSTQISVWASNVMWVALCALSFAHAFLVPFVAASVLALVVASVAASPNTIVALASSASFLSAWPEALHISSV